MPLGFIFWLLMLLALIFGGWFNYGQPTWRGWLSGSLFLWCVLAILGWRVFGFIIQN
jgi:hypothetical protein